jgi:hypothetical protein
MGLFYFHLWKGGELQIDPEGTDLKDTSEARREALLSAREMLAAAIKAGREDVPEAFVIVDEAGRTVATVPLAAALPKALKV